MTSEADVPFERADSITAYLWPAEGRARIVLYEFDAESVERLELGVWEFADYPSHDWEAVLNHVGPWLNRRGLAYEGEAAWNTSDPAAPTATVYPLREMGSRSQ